MIIQSYLHAYEVRYEQGFDFLRCIADDTHTLAVVDSRIYELYASVLQGLFPPERLFLLDVSEEIKDPKTALEICEKAMGIDAKRNLKIVAIGGGIIQDLAGFAAHILYRGVGLILVPTTLLAQGDSCIGSKTSLNYLSHKNILGTIYPPKVVHVCGDFIKTLSDLDFHSGLGEILRFRIMSDLMHIPQITADLPQLLRRQNDLVQSYIKNAHLYKKAMVERDEFDLGERRIFNYGHTFGHAFEALTHFAIPHGLAVLLGMVTANRISLARGLVDEELVESIERIVATLYNAGPLEVPDMHMLIDQVKKDKKRQGAGISAVLLSADGTFEVVQDIQEGEICAAVPYSQKVALGAR